MESHAAQQHHVVYPGTCSRIAIVEKQGDVQKVQEEAFEREYTYFVKMEWLSGCMSQEDGYSSGSVVANVTLNMDKRLMRSSDYLG
jgi:hypothetical protein